MLLLRVAQETRFSLAEAEGEPTLGLSDMVPSSGWVEWRQDGMFPAIAATFIKKIK